MPSSMKAGSSVRNIMTPIGGTPAGYSPPNENDAGSYIKDYKHVFQFAFLVDEKGVIHLTVGTTSNLSKVTGTPMN
jgi:ribosomal protein L1